MELEGTISKFTWKDVAVGLLLIALGKYCGDGYVKLEETVSQTYFCTQYGNLKNKTEEVIEKEAAGYLGEINPSDREKAYNSFINSIKQCE